MTMLVEYASRTAEERPAVHAQEQAHKESAVQHFVELVPSLRSGMHVNVRFSSPDSFEFTKEIAAFDAFPDVQLMHGTLCFILHR